MSVSDLWRQNVWVSTAVPYAHEFKKVKKYYNLYHVFTHGITPKCEVNR